MSGSRMGSVLVLCAITAIAGGCGGGSAGGGAGGGGKPPVLIGTISQTDKQWVCDRPVRLTSVTVTVSTATPDGKKLDAIKLGPGCTGTIDKITVTQNSADGIKVAEGAHDLSVSGGSIACKAKAPDLHQDGIQVMGGSKITFRNMKIDCGRTDADLVDANFFVNEAGQATQPPADVVCDHCDLGGNAAHTASIQSSVRSGVTSSTLCPAKYEKQTLAVGVDAQDPLTTGNTYGDCPGQTATAGAKVPVTMQHS